MGNKFMNKMWNLLGVESDEDYEYDADYENAPATTYTEEKENNIGNTFNTLSSK